MVGTALRGVGLAVVLALGGCDPVSRAERLEGDPDAGAVVFAGTCAACHAEDGTGGEDPGRDGPDLTRGDDTEEQVIDKVTWGWGAMDGFAHELPPRDVADVAAYVVRDVQTGAASP